MAIVQTEVRCTQKDRQELDFEIIFMDEQAGRFVMQHGQKQSHDMQQMPNTRR